MYSNLYFFAFFFLLLSVCLCVFCSAGFQLVSYVIEKFCSCSPQRTDTFFNLFSSHFDEKGYCPYDKKNTRP